MIERDDQDSVNIEIYRKVFLSEHGRVVLADILNELNHMAMDVQSPEELALSNFSKLLLSKLGIWRPHNLKRIVDAYLNMQYTEGVEDGD